MNAQTSVPDPRPQLAGAGEQLAKLIDSVRKEDLDRPTPCAEYDVRGLLAHVVDGMHRFAELGESGSEQTPQPDPDPEGGWTAAYAEARTRLAAAWADDGRLAVPMTVPWGTMPGGVVLCGTVMEQVTHTWDLARALGTGTGELDQDLAGFALGTAQQAVQPERRGEGVPFGPVREAPEGADTYGKLAAWLGRDPEWTAAR